MGGWVAFAGIVVLGPRLGRFGKNGEVDLQKGWCFKKYADIK